MGLYQKTIRPRIKQITRMNADFILFDNILNTDR